jgi:hypothetical protein
LSSTEEEYHDKSYHFIVSGAGFELGHAELEASIALAAHGFDGKQHALRLTGKVGGGGFEVSAKMIFAFDSSSLKNEVVGLTLQAIE